MLLDEDTRKRIAFMAVVAETAFPKAPHIVWPDKHRVINNEEAFNSVENLLYGRIEAINLAVILYDMARLIQVGLEDESEVVAADNIRESFKGWFTINGLTIVWRVLNVCATILSSRKILMRERGEE